MLRLTGLHEATTSAGQVPVEGQPWCAKPRKASWCLLMVIVGLFLSLPGVKLLTQHMLLAG